jgi:hypothetical protein
MLRLTTTLGVLLLILLQSSAALAADASAACGTLCQVMGNFPELNAWLIAIFTFLGLTLRAAAELLGFASKALSKSDNGWTQRLGDWALWCSSVVGWFGGGTPKAVLEKKVEAAKVQP